MNPGLDSPCRPSGLEALYGLNDSTLPSSPEAVIDFPYGFRVYESRVLDEGEGYYIFYVKKLGISSVRAAIEVARATRCSSPSLAGLKDTCAIVYQHVAVKCRSVPPRTLEGRGFKAWLVRRGGRLKPGGHEGNMFLIRIYTSSSYQLCNRLARLQGVPGYFGPQRFGVDRPNSHLYSLHMLQGRLDALINEALYRYPSEERLRPGDYEEKLIHTLDARGSMPRVVAEALQSFLFNLALSKALSKGIDPGSLAERRVHVKCPGGRILAVPAARLPHRSLAKSSTSWAKIVSSAAAETGVDLSILSYDAGLRPSLRPLLFPVCRSSCKPVESEATMRISLPPGAYATVAVRAIAWVDWEESYKPCTSP